MRWIVAPLLMIGGILLMKYSVPLTQRVTGPLEIAEKYLKFMGGTFAWWKLWGLFFTLFGLAWLTGVVNYNPDSELQLPGY